MKARRQNTYLDALDTLPKTKLHFGYYLRKNRRCSKCKAVLPTYEEKMTDVKIAVKLLIDAQDDRFDTAVIISADSDLTPPIKALLQRYPKKRVIVAFPPRRHSDQLKKFASGWFSISRKLLKKSQLSDQVKSNHGFLLTRPREWH